MSAADRLDRLAQALLPGDGDWPGAGDLRLGATMLDLATRHRGNSEAVEAYVDSSGAEVFDEDGDGEARHDAVAHLEHDEPAVFGMLRALAYEAYYSHPRVQDVLAARTGRRPGPAQPAGYPEVFTLDRAPDLSGVRARGLVWRADGTETAARVRAAQEQDPMHEWTEEEIWSWQL